MEDDDLGMRRFIRIVVALGAALVVLLGLIVFSGGSVHRSAKPIRVAAGLNFYGEAARAVAGRYGTTTIFIKNAAVDPHDYQPGTEQARQVATSNVIITNGLGYDTWLNKLAVAGARETRS